MLGIQTYIDIRSNTQILGKDKNVTLIISKDMINVMNIVVDKIINMNMNM